MTAAGLRSLIARLLRDCLDITNAEGYVTFGSDGITFNCKGETFLIQVKKLGL